MTWLDLADKRVFEWSNLSIAVELQKELGFPVSPQTVGRLTRGKRQKLKEHLEGLAMQRKADLIRERARSSAARELAPSDPCKADAIIARAVIRLYESLGSTAPKELETIAYK